MYDIEQIRRRRAIKVIITDIFLACCVLFISFVLVAAVAGWHINPDFTVEQNGLVSVHTKPTDATVIIDGEAQYQKTNMSKMLSGGKHTVRIEKEGYEAWEKEVEITPGWLLRLEYPRLFKIERETKSVKNFEKLNFLHVSPNRNTAIISTDDSTEWIVANDFNANTPKFKKIDIKGIFKDTSNGTFKHKINSIDWNRDGEKLLLNVDGEWGIVDLKEPKKSINLSESYAKYIENTKDKPKSLTKNDKIISAKFENDAGDKVVANVSDYLVRIDTSAKVVSLAVSEKIEKFSLLDSSVIYLTKFSEDKSYIKFINLGEKTPTTIAINSDEKATISFSLTKYNNISYLLYTIDNNLTVYSSHDFPNSTDGKNNMKKIIDAELEITPSTAFTSNNREFIVFNEGQKITVFDSELEKIHSFDYGDKKIRFLDNNIFYRVDENGQLIAWDFDNTNYHAIVHSACDNNYDAFISQNERLFYHIVKTDEGFSLIQEKLW